MIQRSRLLRIWLLLSASPLVGMATTAYAQDNHAHMDMAPASPASATKSVRWSDPSAWPDHKVPGENAAVTIESDRDVVLDVAPAALRSLTIKGKLRFADTRDIELKTDWIYLPGGTLQIGTAERPYTHQATITLTDKVKDENMYTMGDRGIMLVHGSLDLHGNRQHSWTKLANTAAKGSRQITVLNAADWRAGDRIVLASTDFNPRQAEVRTVTAVKGATLTLDQPLEYMHYGKVTDGVDERGEVGLLNRNIKIQASEDAEKTYFGGHIMAMSGSQMHVDGIELRRMGQHMHLARYPIHWHVDGDADGQYIKNSAIHDTYNRCVTVHGTNNLKVEDNVTYNTVGHCFFMEDGIEHGNQFLNNLAIQTKCHPTMDCLPQNLAANGELDYPYEQRAAMRKLSFSGKYALLPSDNTAASFWITNPDNTYRGNVAAGSDQIGFWLSIPEHPNGAFKSTEISAKTWPRHIPLREFKDNVAHSNFDGFMFDRNFSYDDNTFGMTGTTFLPLENPADLESKVVETHLDNLTSYKNRNGGLWSRGASYVYSNLKFADNAIGLTQSQADFGAEKFSALVEKSLFVGETDNKGNPATPAEIAYGRSLPKPKIPDFPIRGYEYYDYRDEVVDTKFVNYQDNAVRKTGALSWLLYTSATVTTQSTVKGAQFVNAKPVYFPKIDPRFDNDNRGGVGYRTSSIHDVDGSVTGIPNSQIIINDGENDSVATDSTCQIRPDWNAAVCKGDVGLLYFSDTSNQVSFGTRAERNAKLQRILAGAGARNAQAARAPEKPIELVREGKDHKVTGNQSLVRAGTEIEVKTERPQVKLGMSEMDLGSWVVFKLPGFTKAASGTEQGSLDALRQAKETSYFKDGNNLWVKLVVDKPPVAPLPHPYGIQASIDVSRSAATVATQQ
ncbi:MAG TPA: G8 domain-containing protein [Acidobacteriaceae bacterium]|nr:G8 domain-containing protein [Acidobacteriaceae bacterium]